VVTPANGSAILDSADNAAALLESAMTSGPDQYVPRGTAWSQLFQVDPSITLSGPFTDSLVGNLMDNYQPIGTIVASAGFSLASDPGPPTASKYYGYFYASFSSSQLLLPTAAQIAAFQQNNGPGAILPAFTYYFSIWDTTQGYEIFQCRFIIQPSTYQ
jgi:hypothetical protein